MPLFPGLTKVTNQKLEVSNTATDSVTRRLLETKQFVGQGQKLCEEMQNSLAHQSTADGLEQNAPQPYECKEHAATGGVCC